MKLSYSLSQILVSLGVIVLVACMSKTPSPKSDQLIFSNSETPNGANSTWVVELYVTGGFAGVQRNIKILYSGNVIIIDEKKNKRIKLDLQQADLDNLSKIIKNINKLPKISQSSSCIDCFVYEVNVLVGTSQFRASYDDNTLNQSEIKPLIVELIKLMNNSLEK